MEDKSGGGARMCVPRLPCRSPAGPAAPPRHHCARAVPASRSEVLASYGGLLMSLKARICSALLRCPGGTSSSNLKASAHTLAAACRASAAACLSWTWISVCICLFAGSNSSARAVATGLFHAASFRPAHAPAYHNYYLPQLSSSSHASTSVSTFFPPAFEAAGRD